MGKSWFVREHAGVRVIGLNSALFDSGLPQEKRMWKFLEKTLTAPVAASTLVLMHHPPFVKSADEPGGTYWNIEPQSRQRLLAWCHRAGVKGVLSGHLHYPLTHPSDGLLLVTTLPVSFGLPKNKQPEGWTLVTISRVTMRAEVRTIPSP